MDLCELYYRSKPPIDENGNIIYYMVGSLQHYHSFVQIVCKKLWLIKEKQLELAMANTIPSEAKDNFSQFRRQINNTDYVYVSDEPNKSFIHNLYDIIPDFDSISPKGKSVLNTSDPRDCELGINLVKLNYNNRSIVVPNPIDIIGFKLLQTVGQIQFIQKTNQKNFEEERKQKIISKHLQEYSKVYKI